jgi:predicted MFS family arabinose efflux permease
VGALGSPLLTAYMDEYGWRSGYVVIAIFTASWGAITFALLPAKKSASIASDRQQRQASRDYQAIRRSRAFWIILISALLCSLPHALSTSQLKLMLDAQQLSSTQMGFIVSVFAVGVIVGRIASGIALDRWAAHRVAAVGMGMPCIGLFLLGAGSNDFVLIGAAVALLGMSFGAEGDILTYLAARYFRIEIYGTVVGLLLATVGAAIVLGSALLSVTLSITESFDAFMIVAAISVLIGGLNFLRLDRAAVLDIETTERRLPS